MIKGLESYMNSKYMFSFMQIYLVVQMYIVQINVNVSQTKFCNKIFKTTQQNNFLVDYLTQQKFNPFMQYKKQHVHYTLFNVEWYFGYYPCISLCLINFCLYHWRIVVKKLKKEDSCLPTCSSTKEITNNLRKDVRF